MNKASLAIAAGLIAAATGGPVFAQTNSTRTTATSTSTSNWLKQPSGNDWLASHLKGVNVYNGQNEKLGSIDELIMDRQGKVQAAVLDVGGLLGMGVHRVAVPFDELRFTDQRANNSLADARPNGTVNRPILNTNSGNAPGNPTAVGPNNTGLGANTAANGQTGAANVTADTVGNAGTNGHADNVPDHAVLNMTADQLKAAPEFHYNS